MLCVYFVIQEQFDLYSKALPPWDRFLDNRLGALGIRSLRCGAAALVVTQGSPDSELPATFYEAFNRPLRVRKLTGPWKTKTVRPPLLPDQM